MHNSKSFTDVSMRKHLKPFKCDRGLIFEVSNLNRNLTQLRPKETQYQPSPMIRSDSLDMSQSENAKDLSPVCFDRLENQS